ncbi:hypothetical protein VZ95_14015 [Elstera litoralis]|uniref:Integrase n=1 Tax=Elstera litoralis TaxID=552518 RepID=A0A0F3IR33_9PROT|nr:hypothetical protein VZ95_14015 [Elstera litoralis]
MNKLKDAGLRSCSVGTYYDGGGLMIKINRREVGRAYGKWLLRISIQGRRHDLGLGSYPEVSLAAARTAAQALRDQIAAGQNPLTERVAMRAMPSFEEAARALYAERRPSWKNGKHADQWLGSLELHAFPVIGSMKVADVGAGDLRAALLPIWTQTPETARRVKQRLGMVLDFSISKGWRADASPLEAVAKGLPPQRGERGHFAALPHAEMPSLLKAIRACTATEITRLALEFLILTAARSGEVRGARWEEITEIEGVGPVWVIPAERMKAARQHRVPLSPAAQAVLTRAHTLAKSEFIFPSPKKGGELADMAFTQLLRRLEWPRPVTAHGCRSSFRDWAAETTDTPHDVVEAALAHALKDKTVAAYLRTDHLERRLALMVEWSEFMS